MQYSSNQFTWHKSTGCADASSIGFPVGYWPATFTVESTKTGVVRMFHIIRGETTHASYIDRIPGQNINAPTVVITVFND